MDGYNIDASFDRETANCKTLAEKKEEKLLYYFIQRKNLNFNFIVLQLFYNIQSTQREQSNFEFKPGTVPIRKTCPVYFISVLFKNYLLISPHTNSNIKENHTIHCKVDIG